MNILISDESKLFQSMLTNIFSYPDMHCIICPTFEDVEHVLATENIDFICLSLVLKKDDGISLCSHIRQLEQYKSTPVILFTAESEKQVYTKALKSGITAVFEKNNIAELQIFIERHYLQTKRVSGRVLYIEDVASQRLHVCKIFRSIGLEVDSYDSAEPALEQFIKQDYDLVVTDIILKGVMTGMELTNRIRRLDNAKGDTPILAVTGFDDSARRIELFSLGVSDYIIKPIIEEELVSRVKNLINAHKYHMEALTQREKAESEGLEKSNFISHMSHELKTPLNTILGYTQLLLSDDFSTDKSKHASQLKQIKNAGNHLLDIINDSLDLSAIEAGKININILGHQLDNVIKRAIEQIHPLTQEDSISVHVHPISPDIIVSVDERRIHQVIMNLLSNAIKYNSKNGDIQIMCKTLVNGKVRLAIKDTGIGMTPEQTSRLFIPFERLQTHNNIEGTGLGLVVCQKIIAAMGGSLGVKSTPDLGSTFWLDLKTVS